jgi:uncharacterized RDD family membrane protein YckC
MKTDTLLIRTPEGIVFSQVLAGPVTRCLAWVVDLACIAAVLSIFGVLARLFDLISPSFGTALKLIGYFVISIGYGIFCEWTLRGQTVGKRLLRLRVVDAEGLRLQFNQIVTRNLLRFVDMMPMFYFVGGVACWCSGKCQRLGDIAANTIVIRQPRLATPDLDQWLAHKYNSLQLHPHLAARLRQRVSPAEAATALQALVRRDDFEAVARVELFGDLARYFRGKVDFPAEATEGITDEQYIRNVVGVVYRTRAEK